MTKEQFIQLIKDIAGQAPDKSIRINFMLNQFTKYGLGNVEGLAAAKYFYSELKKGFEGKESKYKGIFTTNKERNYVCYTPEYFGANPVFKFSTESFYDLEQYFVIEPQTAEVSAKNTTAKNEPIKNLQFLDQNSKLNSMILSGTLNWIADECFKTDTATYTFQYKDVCEIISNEFEKDSITNGYKFAIFEKAFYSTIKNTPNKEAFVKFEIEAIIQSISEALYGIEGKYKIYNDIYKSILITRSKERSLENYFYKYFVKGDKRTFVCIFFCYESIQYLCFLQGDKVNQILSNQPAATGKATEIEPKEISEQSAKLILFDKRATIDKLFDNLKGFFPEKEAELLKALEGEKLNKLLLFPHNQNKFVEVFRRVKYNGYLLSNATEIRNWICSNFAFHYSKGETKKAKAFNRSTVWDILTKGKGEPTKKERICTTDWLPYKSYLQLQRETEREKL